MGGEETMEVACATDKEPGEKQPKRENRLAPGGQGQDPRNAPFGQNSEEGAGDNVCGESRKVYVPKDLKTCSHEYIRRGNEKEARKAWDGRDEVWERSKQAIWIRYKNGSTDEIAIDETRLLQSGKAFAW